MFSVTMRLWIRKFRVAFAIVAVLMVVALIYTGYKGEGSSANYSSSALDKIQLHKSATQLKKPAGAEPVFPNLLPRKNFTATQPKLWKNDLKELAPIISKTKSLIPDLQEIHSSTHANAILSVALDNTLSTKSDNLSIKYEAKWESLDKRPLPGWFDDAKLGIMIHWGVYSVPSFGSEWFWYMWQGRHPKPNILNFMKENYPTNFTYQNFAEMFTAELFNPDEWADLFKESGAKYVVLTSKHHEGFTNWPSPVSPEWNSVDVGPHRDLVGDLEKAVRNRTDLKYGLYYSLYEWFNEQYNNDKEKNYTSSTYVQEKMLPELYDIVKRYKPDIIWTDGDYAPDTYWRSKEFLAWLYNESPVKQTVVTNDRWGTGNECKHGDSYSCGNSYNPGKLKVHKWENCITIDKKSWGYRRDTTIEDFYTIQELILALVSTVSYGGNLLVNIGPTKDGVISPIFQKRLQQLGSWLKINGEAVYSSRPWRMQQDSLNTDVWYTTRSDIVFAFVLSWPKENLLDIGAPIASKQSTVTLLGWEKALEWTHLNNDLSHGMRIMLPKLTTKDKWFCVLKLTTIH